MSLPDPPIYYQIARAVQGRIADKAYRPGAPIPSENELAEEFGVARLTVHHALRQLIAQGILVARRGAGTFVTEEMVVERPPNFLGYLDELILEPLTVDTTVIGKRSVAPPASVRTRLGLGKEEKVIAIERVRRDADVPYSQSVSYLRAEIARLVPVEALQTVSITALLQEQAGVVANLAEQTFTAVAAPKAVAARLELSAGSPVLKRESLLFSEDCPVCLTVTHFPADRVHVRARMIPPPADGNPPKPRSSGDDAVGRGTSARQQRSAK